MRNLFQCRLFYFISLFALLFCPLPANALSNEASPLYLFSYEQNLYVATSPEIGSPYLYETIDGGKTFTQSNSFSQPMLEALQPQLADKLALKNGLSLEDLPEDNQKALYYNVAGTPVPIWRGEFTASPQITRLGNGNIIIWAKTASQEGYLLFYSANNGQTFLGPYLIDEKSLMTDLALNDGALMALGTDENNNFLVKPIYFEKPTSKLAYSKAEKTINISLPLYSSATLKVTRGKIQVFEKEISAVTTTETAIASDALSDGNYLAVLETTNGIFSTSNQLSFNITRLVLPTIVSFTPANTASKIVTFEARFSGNVLAGSDFSAELSPEASGEIDPGIIYSQFIRASGDLITGSLDFSRLSIDGPYLLKLHGLYNESGVGLPTAESLVVIDNLPPVLSFTAEVRSELPDYLLQIKSDQPLQTLTVNGTAEFIDANLDFNQSIHLLPGVNTITIIAADYAGNTSVQTAEVKYLPLAPGITILSPSPKSWFKPGQMLTVNASVEDFQNALEDGASGKAFIQSAEAASSLSYSKDERVLSGLVQLPNDAANGNLTVSLADTKGHNGSATLRLNYDATPPYLKFNGATQYLPSNDQNAIALPIVDDQSGLSANQSYAWINQNGTTAEAAVIVNDSGLTIRFNQLVQEGTLEITGRIYDKVGNVFALDQAVLIDFTAPQITVTKQSIDDTGMLYLEGSINDPQVTRIDLSSNNQTIGNFTAQENSFKGSLKLKAGQSRIVLRAKDPAGNYGQTEVTVDLSQINLSAAPLSNFVYGPNPYNPSQGNFIFSFLTPAATEIKVMIFNILGEKVWQDSQTVSGAARITWDGKNTMGDQLSGGLYLFQLQANTPSSGQSTLEKGKIILLR